MRKIFKFDLDLLPTTTIELPLGAIIRTLQFQRKIPRVWIELDPEVTRTQPHTFTLVATGEGIDDVGEYLTSIQTDDEKYMWHVYHQIN